MTLPQIKFYFNKAKKSYDNASQLQQITGKQLLGLIQKYSSHPSPRMIDLGCGTGFVTQQFASAFQYDDFHAIDIADELLAIAKKRLEPFRIQVYEADFNELHTLIPLFDIAYSNMALHWSNNFSATLGKLLSFMHDQSLFAFSIPLAGTLTELKFNYAFNHFLSLPDVNETLSQRGYDVIEAEHQRIVLPFDNALSALQSIKQVGANYVGQRLNKGLGGKSLIKTPMLSQLTYIIGYFIARKRA